jgi:prevent-host-death family protein
MSGRTSRTARVGIRELRQNLSVYVRRVREDGQAYEVTERGEPVARLLPLEGHGTRVERMMAQGRIAPATGDLAHAPRPLPARDGKSLSQVLDELRDEESH